MESDFSFTVKDALNHPLFQKATLVAGQKGLDKRIRWVHILEVSDFDSLINGEEMILTTGVGLQWDAMSKTSYVKKLINNGASCLCLELGPYFDRVSDEIIQIADQHDFPVIVFNETVRFVDITQELHSIIINRHHRMLKNLESVSSELNRLTLSSQGTTHILKFLYNSTSCQAVCLISQGRTKWVPASREKRWHNWLEAILQKIEESNEKQAANSTIHWTENQTSFLLQPTGAMGQTWAHLVLIKDGIQPDDFDYLVLDRASTAVAQDLLRRMYMEERKLHSENVWVDDLIHRRFKNEQQIKSLLESSLKNISKPRYRICLIEIMPSNEVQENRSYEEQETLRLHIALVIRSIFEKSGFHPLITSKNDYFVVIAVDLDDHKSQKRRLQKTIQFIDKTIQDETDGNVKTHIGFGRCYNQFVNAHLSYQEAQQVLKVNRIEPKSLGCFYEDIGIYRILLHLDHEHIIKPFIADYLQPLIDYDRSRGGDLLHTLRIYLENDGSKKISAEKLYVVRQTLYHRLEKIKELLGDDFMSMEKRLAIEISLRAYYLINDKN